MKRKKRKIKKRNPEAQTLESPLFRQRVVPNKQRPKDIIPDVKEWE
jgi:stalled ribosome alternative rescue factor ArfA